MNNHITTCILLLALTCVLVLGMASATRTVVSGALAQVVNVLEGR